MYAKKIVLSFYEKKFKTEERLDKFIRNNNQKSWYQIRWATQLFKKRRRKVLFNILPSKKTNLEVKADASRKLFIFVS